MVRCSNIFSQLVDCLLNSEYVSLQLILIILEHPHERFLNQTGIHDTKLVQQREPRKHLNLLDPTQCVQYLDDDLEHLRTSTHFLYTSCPHEVPIEFMLRSITISLQGIIMNHVSHLIEFNVLHILDLTLLLEFTLIIQGQESNHSKYCV